MDNLQSNERRMKEKKKMELTQSANVLCEIYYVTGLGFSCQWFLLQFSFRAKYKVHVWLRNGATENQDFRAAIPCACTL